MKRNKPNNGATRHHAGLCSFFSFLLLCLAFCAIGKPAEATEMVRISATSDVAGTVPAFTNSLPPPVQADPCLPLLHAIRYQNKDSGLNWNRRAAGPAENPGIVIGFRIALGPDELTKKRRASRTSFNLWTPEDGGETSNTVAAYRQCQRDKALNALSDWQWKR